MPGEAGAVRVLGAEHTEDRDRQSDDQREQEHQPEHQQPQVGTFADQQGLGFEYGWRAEYDFAKRWGIGVEMFGEIDDLAYAGSFNDQNHSIGPTLFWNPGSEEEEAKGGDEDETTIRSQALPTWSFPLTSAFSSA